MVNVIGVSSKCCNILQDKQATIIVKTLINGEISSRRDLNQETTLKHPRNTRWGSYYGTLVSLIIMFSSTIEVFEIIDNDESSFEQRGEANNLLKLMQSFDFVFFLHLMRIILGITKKLSKILQMKNQDIINAMTLVKICKQQLQVMRENGWVSLLDEVSSFCGKHSREITTQSSKDYKFASFSYRAILLCY